MLGSVCVGPPLLRVWDPSLFTESTLPNLHAEEFWPLKRFHFHSTWSYSYMINGQDIQCVHFIQQTYLANAGPFCFTKIELFAVTWTMCYPTLHEMMISCLQDLVSQRAVAKLKYSLHTERSNYLGSLSLDGLLLVRMPLTPLRRLNWSHYKNIQALSYCLALQISLAGAYYTVFTESSSHPLTWKMTLHE